MGRFLSNKPLLQPAASPALAVEIGRQLPRRPIERTAVPPSGAALPTPVQAETSSSFHQLGFYAYCVIAMSFTGNDLLRRVLGEKAILYWTAFPIAIVLLLTCGTIFRGLRVPVGRLWLAFGGWLILGVPTSLWPGGSLGQLQSYLPRLHLLFFFITAFVITRKQCRQLMEFNVVSSFVILGICVAFGGVPAETGRFCIPKSIFFTNPNDLSIQLITGLGGLVYWLFSGNRIKIGLSIGGLALTSFYILKTGSRGTFVAGAALLVIAFFVTKTKGPILALVVLGVALIPFLPSQTLHRLTTIMLNTEGPIRVSEEDGGSVGSQMQRQFLFRRSLEITFQHPLFGVGVGEFIDATSGADAKKGRHSEALGTHNSYTQISSETGLPGLIFYAGALFLSLRLMIKLYRTTWNRPELRDVSAMGYSMWISIAAFALSSTFHHIGYSQYAAMLCGCAVAIHMAVKPYLQER